MISGAKSPDLRTAKWNCFTT